MRSPALQAARLLESRIRIAAAALTTAFAAAALLVVVASSAPPRAGGAVPDPAPAARGVAFIQAQTSVGRVQPSAGAATPLGGRLAQEPGPSPEAEPLAGTPAGAAAKEVLLAGGRPGPGPPAAVPTVEESQPPQERPQTILAATWSAPATLQELAWAVSFGTSHDARRRPLRVEGTGIQSLRQGVDSEPRASEDGASTNLVSLQPAAMAAKPGAEAAAVDRRPMLAARIFNLFVSVVLVFSIAFIYVKCGSLTPAPAEGWVKPPADGQEQGFYFGLLDFDGCCGRDQKICFCAICCVSIRWAETMSQDKLKLGLSFWAALAIPAFCYGLQALTAGLSAVAFACVAAHYRQRLRLLFGLKNSTLICLADCLTWWWCCWCAAAQEARQVEYVTTKSEV